MVSWKYSTGKQVLFEGLLISKVRPPVYVVVYVCVELRCTPSRSGVWMQINRSLSLLNCVWPAKDRLHLINQRQLVGRLGTVSLVPMQRTVTYQPSWWKKEGSTRGLCWPTALQLPWVSAVSAILSVLTHTHTHTHTRTHTRTYTHTCTHTYTHTCTCTHTHTHTCTHTCTHTYTHAHTHMHMHTCTQACMHKYTPSPSHSYTCIIDT